MIVQKAITGTAWTALTTAGQSCSCWLDEQDDGAAGKVDVRIFHNTSAPGDADVTKGKRLYKPLGNTDVTVFTADSISDVLYARCANAGDTATVSVDV